MNKITKRVWISLMARSDGYNTKTRQLILDYLINNRQHAVSASNILEHLEALGASPNPTTVYRYLDKLAGEQRIMKYVADKGEKAVFQYVDEGRHCAQKEEQSDSDGQTAQKCACCVDTDKNP